MGRWATRTTALAISMVSAVAAIGASSPPASATTPPDDSSGIVATADATAEGCDPIDPRLCYLPFPSNHYTADDPASATGRRVAFPSEGAPVNAAGVQIDVTEWNRNDGFSPNSTLLTHVPGLDAEASALPSWTDLGGSLDADAPVVIIDVDSGERVPLWAELDTRGDGLPDDQLLVIHPAVVLTEGHTYAVALRDLVATDGSPIAAGEAFSAILDGTADGSLADRAAELAPALDALEAAGVARESLVLAWDFTVASTTNTTGRMVHIRDATLAELGDAAPEFTVSEVIDDPTHDDGTPREGLARTVIGTYNVTNWLTGDGAPGERFHYDADTAAEPDALPAANGTLTATFQCNIPEGAMTGADPAHLVQYGHGLLGTEGEINAGNQIRLANAGNSVICATRWAGMSTDDIGNAIETLGDFSNFPSMADRLQQGVLNQLVLTRLLLADDGLTADPSFQRADGTPIADASVVAYNGNSQGAIMGLMLAGVSTDIDRFVVGVAGMNYGLLLPRSVDFHDYEAIFVPAYPNVADRALILAMVQMLWDRGEGAGYVSHVTADPLPGTPAKDVLMHVAFGDWQVSELTAFIAARAMAMPVHRPVTEPGRSGEVEPGWGLETLEYPSNGSGLVVWDSGSDPIPLADVAPSTTRDPHEDPRADPDAQLQINTFLFDGELIDVCAAAPCLADPTD
ncbi:hypothetical protein [Desertimonas flava]|uniref:hypothetical protein n=1 Tax=Desertimonas flava TaxID=2064846 RepID=UPI0013C46196|nr:hypothetical protein [Desertimonas flava]